MEVLFLKSFVNDIKKIKEKALKEKLKGIIVELEQSENLSGFSGIKKLKNHPNAYRLRVGNYRLGFYKLGNEIHLDRFLKRNDIYKIFP